MSGLGNSPPEWDADLVKCGDDRRSHGISRGGARGADEHAITGKLSQDAGGELRSPGVLYADEEHFGNGVMSRFGPGERVKTEGGERGDSGPEKRRGTIRGQKLVTLGHIAFDGLRTEYAAISLGKVFDDSRQIQFCFRSSCVVSQECIDALGVAWVQ